MKPDAPGVSVILPTRDRPASLRRCLKALTFLEYPQDAWELIVVDDGGHNSLSLVSDELASMLPLQIHAIQHSLPAGARNAGARLASGEILAFLDDDCRVAPDWLTQFASGFQGELWDALGGQSLSPDSRNLAIESWAYVIEFLYAHLRDEQGNALLIVSNNAAYRRESFEALGGFDESFKWAEDRDISLRLLAAGGRQAYLPSARVWHTIVDATASNYLRKQFNYGQGAAQLVRKADRLGLPRQLIDPSGGGRTFRDALWQSLRIDSIPLSMRLLIYAGQLLHRMGQSYGLLRSYDGVAPERPTVR